ncbi:hypothetical protein [Glycomyces artemisiae]|nr:hypothetical protein [Glycomyces artemisiae]
MLELSPQRRQELLQLLDEPERMKTEYPLLARYSETAPFLAGTGNDEVDASFELRFLHYMSAAAPTDPYWSIVSPLVSRIEGRRVLNGGSPDGSPRLGFAQTVLQEAFAYAVPSPETISWIRAITQGRKVIEAGAGRGYWAHQMRSQGIDVLAFDVEPPDAADNASFSPPGRQPQTWHEVEKAGRLSQLALDATDAVLFLCWPPGWGNTMSSESLDDFVNSGGSRLIYVGEPKGGKTGDHQFFSALSDSWDLESTDDEFVSWWNLNDQAQFWVRKSGSLN